MYYNVYRTFSGGTPSTTGKITQYSTSALTLNDTGLSTYGSVPPANTTGNLLIAGSTGIGTTAPATALHVSSGGTATETGIVSEQLGATVSPPQITLYKNRGTRAVPVAVAAYDILGALNFSGYDGANDLPSAIVFGAWFGAVFASRSERKLDSRHGLDAQSRQICNVCGSGHH
jgi:hypothetical protein